MDRLNDSSEPIKICYIAHYASGGSATSLQSLVSNLDRSRFSPIVLFHWIENPALVEALQAEDIPVFSLTEPQYSNRVFKLRVNLTSRLSGSSWRRKLLAAYQFSKAMRAFVRQDLKLMRPLLLLQERSVDLIHFNNGLRHHRAGLLVSHWLGIPAVCHVRAFQTLTPLERFASKNVKRFFYISRAIAADCESQKIAPERGEVIHNAVCLPPLVTDEDKALLRAEFGWDEGHFVIVNVGRLVRWKGQDVFLKAIHHLAADIPNLRSLIVGQADDNQNNRTYAQGLKKLATEYGIADKVVFTGFRSDAIQLMAAADLVVHSATKPEPFGRVIIEGMARGTPVIGADDGGVSEIITPGVNGILVRPGDDWEMAHAIKRLADDPVLRAKLGQAGRLHVKKNFSIVNHVRQIEQIYLDCLKE